MSQKREQRHCSKCGIKTEHKIDVQEHHLVRPNGEIHKKQTHVTCLSCNLTVTSSENLKK